MVKRIRFEHFDKSSAINTLDDTISATSTQHLTGFDLRYFNTKENMLGRKRNCLAGVFVILARRPPAGQLIAHSQLESLLAYERSKHTRQGLGSLSGHPLRSRDLY